MEEVCIEDEAAEEAVEGGAMKGEAAAEHVVEVEGGWAWIVGWILVVDKEAEDEGGSGGVEDRIGFDQLLEKNEGLTACSHSF